MIRMRQIKKGYNIFMHYLPKLLQVVLNLSLVCLAMILSFLLLKELFIFSLILLGDERADYQLYLANILIYFLYFEFIAIIVIYFKEDYNFPLRYFLYINITFIVFLFIVEDDKAVISLFYFFFIFYFFLVI